MVCKAFDCAAMTTPLINRWAINVCGWPGWD